MLKDISGDGGLVKEILKKGKGKRPVGGSNCTIHYRATWQDGTVFESTIEQREPLTFTLGENLVIKAWEQGVPTMRIGEKCLLHVKPEYGYGEKGMPPKVPPNCPLIYEI